MGCCQSAAATSAYPGNRRPVKPTYQPNDNEYKSTADKNTKVCIAHFVTCPGGNALRLVDKPNRAAVGEEVNSGGLARYISVTLPDGVQAGDVIHVRAPDGRLNAITVPDGMGPGSTFTVEFSTDVEPPKDEEALTPGVYVPTVVAEPEVETGVPYNPSYKGGDGMESSSGAVTAQPTSGPYVPASYAP